VIRSGVDLIEVDRIDRAILRHGKRFFDRFYTAQELIDARGRKKPSQRHWGPGSETSGGRILRSSTDLSDNLCFSFMDERRNWQDRCE
jgi:hypothetical protein